MAVSFAFSEAALDAKAETASLADAGCGGFASFEGWVRDHNEGQRVLRLEYEAYQELALREGERIVAEAAQRFAVRQVRCVHRVGALELGELAVWVGVAAVHRAEAFAACRYVIDEVKHRLPIWKKEHYASGDSGWVNCERCAQPAAGHGHDHAARAHEVAAPAAAVSVDYSRQMRLPEVGSAGQARLRAARVLVVGAGGLGVPVLGYLAGAGVGVLGLIDGDLLDASNLHRQTAYALAEVGEPKALLAARRLRALNPEVDVRAYVERATPASLAALLPGYDVVVDCADNFSTTYAIHDAARAAGVDAVFASLYQYEGQLQVVRGHGQGSCLRCLWAQDTPDGVVGNCIDAGVLGPVPGVLGSLQALETLKLLLDLPGALRDELLIVDLLSLQMQRLRVRRSARCEPACSQPRGGVEPAAGLELALATLRERPATGYALIDIRETGEISAEPGPQASLHIPLGRLLDDPSALPTDRDCVLFCARGTRSRGAVATLRARGLARIWSLKDGVAAFTGAG